jgi:addiction module HigA family antidote
MSARQLAEAIGVPPNRISDIVWERRDVAADTAIRLGRCFGINGHLWLNLQQSHDLSKAEAENDYSGIRKRAA